MKSLATISTPRVGWPTIRQIGRRPISRAQTSFCWLPPDRVPVGALGSGGRTSYSSMRRRAALVIAPGAASQPRAKGGLSLIAEDRVFFGAKFGNQRHAEANAGNRCQEL